jgi:hypothetical protein
MHRWQKLIFLCILLFQSLCIGAQEYHVSTRGNDNNPGTLEKPFKTISKAAAIAQAGDVITVHEGIYRERVNPPRGGTSDENRIIYQAAEQEKVIIKGSEVIKDWQRFKGNVWKVRIPNAFFGDYHPYQELIHGDWFVDNGRMHHTGEVYLNGQSLFEVPLLEQVLHPKPLERTDLKEASAYTWYTESDDSTTYIYANFHEFDPNQELVEIHVRPTCFYPEKTGINYITVRGFQISQAATQWAPPTAEQIGLIGTNWSKGWIIEDNIVHDSKCTGITLGKDRASGQNLWSKAPSIDGATHYNRLIDKIQGPPYNWSKENIGSHIVRNNVIYNCEQAGICGSMGCAFSLVENNHIYDIWTKRQFEGAEIAGIKFHGPIDAIIRNNRINNCLKGIWLDWMTQGTRVTSNLVYDTYLEDLFVEVNHGPFTIDNNLFLSKSVGLLDGSSGGAYLHNIIVGKIVIVQQARETPFHLPHVTAVLGRATTRNADNRFYNNIFSSVDRETNLMMPNHWWVDRGSYGLGIYQGYYPMYVDGNVYFHEAEPYPDEPHALHLPETDPGIRIEEKGEEVFLHLTIAPSLLKMNNSFIDTDLLGRVKTSDTWFEHADGSPLEINVDYFGIKRDSEQLFPGPFSELKAGKIVVKVWPK